MPKITKITKRNTKRIRKTMKRNKRKSCRKYTGGNEGPNIPNYALNTHEVDPNYMQVSARNVFQQGSGKKRMRNNNNKRQKGGGDGLLEFASKQFVNPITNFSSFYTNSNYNSSPAYVQPIGTSHYTGQTVNYYGNNIK